MSFIRTRRRAHARRGLSAAVWLVAVALFAVACGDAGDDTDTSSSDGDVVEAAELSAAIQDTDLTLIAAQLASGLGTLGTAQQAAVQGAASGDAVCDHEAEPRARVAVSQIEVEIVSLRDGCLHFSYTVANFRTLVEDIRQLRLGDDVIAVSPLLLDYRLNQIESDWPVEAISGPTLRADSDTPTGQGITVAIIDSGIDMTSPLVANARVRRAPDSGRGDYAPTGHGTVAAAVIVSPIGRAQRAIAPAVELLDVPADLCDPDACGCDPCAPMTPAEAIRWSVDNGADIISMSFGYQPSPKPVWWQLLLDADELRSASETLEVALAYANAHGISMAAAAGNCADGATARCDTRDQFEIPAGHPAVIGVSALAPDEAGDMERAWYSTRQAYVELAAPGNLLLSVPDDEPIEKNGTSYATPFVSAALAVLIGTDGPLAGQNDVGQIARQILVETAVDLAPEGRDNAFGHGQLQLSSAVAAAFDYAANNPAPTPTPIAADS